jgi:hypothetical protein
MNPPRTIAHRLFADGVTRPVYENERGQFIVDDGERIDGLLTGQVAQVAFGNQQPIAGPYGRAVDRDEDQQAAVPEIRLNDRPPPGETPVPEIRGKGRLAADERRVVLHRDLVPA